MAVMVTGATGSVGRHFVNELAGPGEVVRATGEVRDAYSESATEPIELLLPIMGQYAERYVDGRAELVLAADGRLPNASCRTSPGVRRRPSPGGSSRISPGSADPL